MTGDQAALTVAEPSPTDALLILMLRLREAIMHRLRPLLRDRDITEQQWRVLRVVSQAGVLDMHEAAQRACIQPPSLSRIIRKLAGRGLVQRLSTEMDQRRVQVRLTPDGHALLRALGPKLWRASGEVLRIMDEELVQQVTDLLGVMLGRLPSDEACGLGDGEED